MIIYIKLLINNNFIEYDININSKNINDFKKFIFLKNKILPNEQIWFFKNKKLNNNFILKEGLYNVYDNQNNMISLSLNINGKIINTPFVNNNMKIKELKNILSIKDYIYFNNIKLNENNTFKYYNINNDNILQIKPIIHVEY